MTTKRISMVVFRNELENILKNMDDDCGVIVIEQVKTSKCSDGTTQIIHNHNIKVIG